jgi:hypothetical protein
MKTVKLVTLAGGATLLIVAAVRLTQTAHSSEPPLSDKRISVHTLLREDIFAGILEQDMERLAKGEKNIEILLAERPKEKPALLVWKGGVRMLHAVRAREAGNDKEFNEKYQQALDLLAEAKKLGPKDFGVTAATAGIYAIFADRLPEKQRNAAWEAAYESYKVLWKYQERAAKTLPLHLRGEMLGGLAESAQRTGHKEEFAQYLDKILELAPESPYARAAAKWKEDPRAAADTRITCLTCHSAGRLAARQSALGKEKGIRTVPNG